jgi:glutathione S-transferase
MIHFYGAPMSSAGRTHWMLEECGAPYEYHRINVRDPAAKAEILKVNPGGKIPFLVDGDLRLPESIAINLYLAEKYAPALWSTSVEDRARITAWSLWSITNLQPFALEVMRHTMMLPEDKRRPEAVVEGKAGTQRHLDELEAALPAGGFLVGGKLSVADINVGSTVNLTSMIGIALGPKTKAWLDALKARPAYQSAAKAG